MRKTNKNKDDFVEELDKIQMTFEMKQYLHLLT